MKPKSTHFLNFFEYSNSFTYNRHIIGLLTCTILFLWTLQVIQNNDFHQKDEIIQLGLIYSSNGIAIIQKLIKIVRLPNLDETSP